MKIHIDMSEDEGGQSQKHSGIFSESIVSGECYQKRLLAISTSISSSQLMQICTNIDITDWDVMEDILNNSHNVEKTTHYDYVTALAVSFVIVNFSCDCSTSVFCPTASLNDSTSLHT